LHPNKNLNELTQINEIQCKFNPYAAPYTNEEPSSVQHNLFRNPKQFPRKVTHAPNELCED